MDQLCPQGDEDFPHHLFELIEANDIPQPGRNGTRMLNGWVWVCPCGSWKRVTLDPGLEVS